MRGPLVRPRTSCTKRVWRRKGGRGAIEVRHLVVVQLHEVVALHLQGGVVTHIGALKGPGIWADMRRIA